MNFTLRQLQAFRETATTLSFTKAAAKLFMTSPAVLKQVRSLENNLNVELFTKAGKQLILTQAGAQLLVYVQEYLQQTENLQNKMQHLQQAEACILNVSVMNTMQGLFYPHLKRFRELNPLINFKLSVVPWAEQAKQLLDPQFQFYFTADIPFRSEDFIDTVFGHWSFKLVAPAGFSLAGKKLSLDTIRELQFVTGSASSSSQNTQDKMFAKWRLVHEPIRVDSYDSVREAVRAGVGVALLPDAIVDELIEQKELVRLAFPIQSPKFPLRILNHKQKSTLPAMQVFKDFFLQTWASWH